jgi:NAD(P)-dependent dehydrogenase (short-subunit alcohol dehydrogenase family)
MLATTFKDARIRVNVIAPGIFPSEMTTGKSDEKNKSELSRNIGNPAGRGGHDSDMAATILFLAGKGGLFYNEQVLYPDGGEVTRCSRKEEEKKLTDDRFDFGESSI